MTTFKDGSDKAISSGGGASLPTTLTGLLAESQSVFAQLSDGTVEQDRREAVSARCDTALRALQMQISREGIFSPNETLEDIETDDLPLLATEYMLGSLQLKLPFTGPEARRRALERADSLLSHYLAACARLSILADADLKTWRRIEAGDGAPPPQQSREEKIARFRRAQEAQRRRAEIVRELAAAAAAEDTAGGGSGGAAAALGREAHVLALEAYAREALDEVPSIEKEREILAQMAALGGGGSQQRSAMADARAPQRGAEGGGGRGLEVTHVSKVNGQLQMQKELVRARVFQPTIAPPTMSLEEYADREVAEAMERAEREKNAPQPDRRFEQLVADGEDDNVELLDKATIKDREWDAWKEDHPKGYGNKANKRF
ncbi:TAP42-like protein [Tribonema minus]|uniref:TAP42-like protein n=1 Tax=Tribonema minus TaxID=303371 RepID=A0A835ZK81_9STRA|nr:TAP42-like protein [Tribonema minus]